MTSFLKIVASDATTAAAASATFSAANGQLQTTSNSSGRTVPYPSTTSSDIMVMVVGHETGTPDYTGSGWTKLGDYQNTGDTGAYMQVWYKDATGSESGTFDLTGGGAKIGGAVIVAVDGGGSVTAGVKEDSDLDPPSITPANNGSCVLSILYSRRTPSPAITGPSNMTVAYDAIVDSGKWSPAVYYYDQTTAAAFDPGAWTHSNTTGLMNLNVVVGPILA